MAVKPKILVLTLNWNGEKWLRDCLDSVSQLNYDNYRILVVDNASSDNSVNLIEAEYPNIKLIRNKKNI